MGHFLNRIVLRIPAQIEPGNYRLISQLYLLQRKASELAQSLAISSPGGDSHMKRTGMLVGIFVKEP